MTFVLIVTDNQYILKFCLSSSFIQELKKATLNMLLAVQTQSLPALATCAIEDKIQSNHAILK